MNSINNTQSRRKAWIISSTLVVVTVISTVLVLSLRQKQDSRLNTVQGIIETPTENTSLIKLITSNELITAHLDSLRTLDENYGTLLTGSNNRHKIDSIYRRINVEEKLLQNSLDSLLLNNTEQVSSDYNRLFTDIISTYRSVLQNRQSMNRLRNFVKLGEKKFDPDEIAMLQNQEELQEKDSRIESLEAMLTTLSQKKASAQPSPTSGSNDNINLLKDNVEMQKRRIEALATENNSLKQENDELVKQQMDALEGVRTSDVSFNNRTAGLQQKIDALNAELSLARVDCNLSRVDAAQIISNSKQRKQLLSEASGILTNLLKSGDVTVKKKVQDKITLLNQVAANSRD